ncbi:MAG: hypothetical protein IPI49_18685 [Myxococcales bacterium]|jgi:hypothetical protein|nr:hypothetical protein [Myxococcales bacterium]HRC58424.1 hypothetical protein [Kofleriaceae bacterium]
MDSLQSISLEDLSTVAGGEGSQQSGSAEATFPGGSAKATYDSKTSNYSTCVKAVTDACNVANPPIPSDSYFSSSKPNPEAGKCTLTNLDKCKGV